MSQHLVEYSIRLCEESQSLIKRTLELREQSRQLKETSKTIRQALRAFQEQDRQRLTCPVRSTEGMTADVPEANRKS